MNIFKRILFLALVCLLSLPAARADEPRFGVLTCSPGSEVYALYGHTALRYCDPSTNTDIVFNYGIFNFDAPNFVWRFVLGETDYMVCATQYRYFLQQYELRGSAVAEQRLNLTPSEERSLFAALVDNCKPQNMVYRYRYLDNNCTTKVRDMLLQALGDSVQIVYDGAEQPSCTYRESLEEMSQSSNPWYTFGVNLLMGADIDEEASREALQFLPRNFMNDLDAATIVAPDGSRRKLVDSTNLLADAVPRTIERNNFTPFNVSLLLLLATFVAMLCELRKRKTYWGVDILLMLPQGLAGALILFMVLFSQHPAVGSNWLLLLLNPVALLLLPIIVHRATKHRSLTISWVQVAMVLLFLLSGIIGLQHYPAPVYFYALALMARALFHLYKDKICELNIV